MRTDGDSWDIVSSVGLTALGVATFRALETVRPDALIQDDFARWFVEAAGEPHFTGLLADPSSLGDMPVSGFMGSRTKFFDEFFSTATSSGVSQALILAAGLDARAYRLDWPTGTTVFEVDQPQVLKFKEEVLADHGAKAKADRRPVAVDLRDDWPAALHAAGFDPGKPTAWSVEGLLAYLPGRRTTRCSSGSTNCPAPAATLPWTTSRREPTCNASMPSERSISPIIRSATSTSPSCSTVTSGPIRCSG